MTTTSVREIEPPRTLAALLECFDETPASYMRVARQFEGDAIYRDGLRELRVALLATFTIDLLRPYLVVEGARRGLVVRPTVAPFAQLEQQLLEAESEAYRSNPEVVIIAVRLEDAAPALSHAFIGLAPGAIEQELEDLTARISRLIYAVRDRSNAHILVWNQVMPRRLAAGIAEAQLEPSQTDAIADLNRRIARACRAVPSAWVFDVCRIASEIGVANWEDPKLALLAHAPLSAAAHIATARRLARWLRALLVPPCKCLVLDLDNTLWGGVLADEGIQGIALGEDYPGNVYLDFQRQLVSYRDRGILLAIASKNNAAEVLELFDHHPSLALQLEDFAARQIHWNDKASSLAAIACELNIGTDSLAFFDDSPIEREWVRRRMPEVHVIDVPSDPLGYGAALEESGAFDALALTHEDRGRANQYRSEQRRRQLAASSWSVEDFLRSLAMRVHIGAVDTTTLPRVVQLIAKTNQFNLTTRRHPQTEVERMIANGAIALWMRVEDRFGDSGIVGVALAVDETPDRFLIDTFVLSCRVLGRKVEAALVAAVARHARDRGATGLDAMFIPTGKNAPAENFLPEHGFQPVAEERHHWRLELACCDIGMPGVYEVIDKS